MTDIRTYSWNIRPKFIPEFIWLWIIIIIPCSLSRNVSLCHSCWTSARDIIKLFTLYIPDARDPSAENKISSRICHEYSCARSLASRVDSCVSPSLRVRKSFALSPSYNRRWCSNYPTETGHIRGHRNARASDSSLSSPPQGSSSRGWSRSSVWFLRLANPDRQYATLSSRSICSARPYTHG